ncbi:hypothetical protein PIB30_094224 [Stylosanthes scabra]|uniref:Uncharacterized protein n=1 Tax=Stylosanthes scabra TaxID=79078 RepID=A0ABU6XV16_9FABA|nr:hypothetical protein [Stylosanthes scabra]
MSKGRKEECELLELPLLPNKYGTLDRLALEEKVKGESASKKKEKRKSCVWFQMEAGTRRQTRRREGLSTTTLVDTKGKVRLTATGGGLWLDLVRNGGGGGGDGCEWGCGGGSEIGRGGEIGGEGLNH